VSIIVIPLLSLGPPSDYLVLAGDCRNLFPAITGDDLTADGGKRRYGLYSSHPVNRHAGRSHVLSSSELWCNSTNVLICIEISLLSSIGLGEYMQAAGVIPSP
jgi:hypothetical protein